MALKPLIRTVRRSVVTSNGNTVVADLTFGRKLKSKNKEKTQVDEFVLSRKSFNDLQLENRGATLFIDDETNQVFLGTTDPKDAVIFRGKVGMKKSLTFTYAEAVAAFQKAGTFPQDIPVNFKQAFELKPVDMELEGVYELFEVTPKGTAEVEANLPQDEIPGDHTPEAVTEEPEEDDDDY